MGQPLTSRGISAGAARRSLEIDPALFDRILGRLGFTSTPAADLEGLRAVYSAWCLEVPFDNVGKLIALRTTPDATFPGMVGVEFLERWLTHGIGGTCWPSSNALYELLIALGFEARRIAASMGDTGIVSHGSVTVTCHSRCHRTRRS